MPLSEYSLAMLNQLRDIDCNGKLETSQDDLIKDTFKKILSRGETYGIKDIENWIDNCHLINPILSERILNVAHYLKAKSDSKNPLKMVHDGCGCGGDC